MRRKEGGGGEDGMAKRQTKYVGKLYVNSPKVKPNGRTKNPSICLGKKGRTTLQNQMEGRGRGTMKKRMEEGGGRRMMDGLFQEDDENVAEQNTNRRMEWFGWDGRWWESGNGE
jgi:hypothetical protein